MRSKIIVAAALALSAAARAFSFTYVSFGAVWQPGTIAMKIKMDSTPVLIDGSNFASSVQIAMAIWNSNLGTVQFTSTVLGAGVTDSNDTNNEIAFSSTVEGTAFGSGVLAVTLSSSYPSIHQFASSDILFNSTRTWNSYRGNLTSSEDIRRVALHELGHVLGLDHPDQAGQSVSAIMNSTASNLDALAADDIAGAQSLYGLPGVTAPPPNDNFANATAITLTNNTAVVTGSTIFGSKQSGEPNHAGYSGGKSSWWKWTAPSNGTLVINADGSKFDTLMGVYMGTSVNALTTIASNDNRSNGTLNYSYVSIASITTGNVYWIAIDGYNAASGSVTLTLTFTPAGAPTNAPAFTVQPTSTTSVAGNAVQFSTSASGSPAPTYQWQRLAGGIGSWTNISNGGAYAGATTGTLTVTTTTAMNGDQYRNVATNSAGNATSTPASLNVTTVVSDPGRLINLSVRTNAGTGSETLIVGLVIGGFQTVGTKPLLLRAVGPTLTGFGVPGALADTKLELVLFSSGVVLSSNDNWGGNAQVSTIGTAVGAFPLSSTGSLDAALYTSPAKDVYSVKVTGAAGTTGVALAEIYDATPAGTSTAATPRLVNVSARTQVGTGDNVLIAGFVVGGSTPCTVLIRGIGPTLTGFGVPGALSDPELTLLQRVNGSDVQIAYNNDWGQSANVSTIQSTATQVGAFDIATNTKDAVLLFTLQPGVYSAKVSGVGNTTGVALVEIYEVR